MPENVCSNFEEFYDIVKDNRIIQGIEKINKRYKIPRIIVSGGFISRIYNKIPLCVSDIDVYILGSNKSSVCKEIIKELYTKFEEGEYTGDIWRKKQIKVYDGIVSVYNIPHCIEDKHVHHNKELDIILKENAKTPNDIFCMFDLDCCKIGWFPGDRKLVCSKDFVRSMKSKLNYCGFDLRYFRLQHFERIFKYYERFGIYSTFEQPPLMSFYHNFKTVSENDILSFIDVGRMRLIYGRALTHIIDFYLYENKDFIGPSYYMHFGKIIGKNLPEFGKITNIKETNFEFWTKIFGITKNEEQIFIHGNWKKQYLSIKSLAKHNTKRIENTKGFSIH